MVCDPIIGPAARKVPDYHHAGLDQLRGPTPKSAENQRMRNW